MDLYDILTLIASGNAVYSLLPCVWSLFRRLEGSWIGTRFEGSGLFPKLFSIPLCSNAPWPASRSRSSYITNGLGIESRISTDHRWLCRGPSAHSEMNATSRLRSMPPIILSRSLCSAFPWTTPSLVTLTRGPSGKLCEAYGAWGTPETLYIAPQAFTLVH